MNDLNLMLHCGGKTVTPDELERVVTPEATSTWQPISHIELLNKVKETLTATGLRVTSEAHGLARDGMRYFGMMQIANGEEAAGGYGFVTGLRNSHDQSFPSGLVVGSGVFVCDNLSFSGEIRLSRKHTLHIRRDLPQLIQRAVGKLADYRQRQVLRYERYRTTEIVDRQANDLIIQALDARIVPLTRIPEVLTEWRSPRHPEFSREGKTGWRLFNAFTEALKGGDPTLMMKRTMALHGLMDSTCGVLKEVVATTVA